MPSTTLREELQQHIRAPLEPQLIYLAVKLGIPDLLRDGPRTSTELAQHTAVHAASLHRVLRGMAILGIVREEADNHFSLTPKGTFLQREHPDTLYDDALITGELLPAWAGLLRSIQTGEPAFDAIFGQGLFSYAAHHPELEQGFSRHMAGMTTAIANAVISAYDFSGAETVVDIGGGYGTLLIGILTAYPALHGVLFDLPAVVASARERLASAPVGTRADCVPGDFFQGVPLGGDMYVLQVVIHDWDDAAAVRILTNCAQAMRDNGRILLIERLLPEKALDAPAVIQGDLNMLVLTGGRERTAVAYDRLLTAAGLELTQVVPTQLQWSIIEGKRRRAAAHSIHCAAPPARLSQ
jgi:hypothetical protein